MSFVGEPNADAYRGSVDQGSAGPLLGFMDGLDAAWTAQTKVHSLLAVEQSMRAIEQSQIKKMREAGLRPHASLDDSDDYNVNRGPFNVFDTKSPQYKQGRYSAAAQAVVDGGGWYTDEMVAERDKQIEGIKKDRPDLGLMTYAEMFEQVRKQSQEIEKRNAGPKTFGGEIGSFIGSAAGGMNPVSDPINAATMLLGGGKTIAERLALQGVTQFGTEATNMALTPNNENILLDQQPTFGQDVARLGFAVAGGVGGQAIGEAATAGLRRLRTGRWFNDVPPPKPVEPHDYPRNQYGPWQGEVPPKMEAGRPINDYPDWESFVEAHGGQAETPYGKTREAALRTALDLDHVTAELQRWDGPAPHEVLPPRTDTAFIREPERGVAYDKPYQKFIDSLDTVDDIARRIDPDLFRTYDHLSAQRADIDASIERAKGPDVRPDASRSSTVVPKAPAAPETRLPKGLEFRVTPRDGGFVVDIVGADGRTHYSMIVEKAEHRVATVEDVENITREHAGLGFALYQKAIEVAHARGDRVFGSGSKYARRVWTQLEREGLAEKDQSDFMSKAFDDSPVVQESRPDVAAEYAAWQAATDQELRLQLQQIDYQMRDLAPLVTRAYAAANKEWRTSGPSIDTLRFLRDLENGTGWRFRGEGKQSLTERPPKIPAKNAPATVTVTPEDRVPLASISDRTERMQKVNAATSDAADRVQANVKEDLAAMDETVDAFVTQSAKVSKLDDVELGKAIKTAEEKLAAAVEPEAKAKAAADLDALKYVTLPDGSKLDIQNDRVPYVDENGNGRDVSVREFLQEMQKDNDALKSVMTCSRPG